jgi:hypothetical protein
MKLILDFGDTCSGEFLHIVGDENEHEEINSMTDH